MPRSFRFTRTAYRLSGEPIESVESTYCGDQCKVVSRLKRQSKIEEKGVNSVAGPVLANTEIKHVVPSLLRLCNSPAAFGFSDSLVEFLELN